MRKVIKFKIEKTNYLFIIIIIIIIIIFNSHAK